MTPRTESLAPSVPEAVGRILRERILEGELAPGAPLREAALAEEFDVSRNTIREALLLLERGGLVEHRPHRGSRVTRASPEHLRDVMSFRKAVEPGALRQLSPEDPRLDELAGLADRLERAAAAEDWIAYGELDRAFHTALVGASGSARLTAAFRSLIDELRLHFDELDRTPAPGSRGHVEEHRAMVEAVRAGDRRAALRLLDRHLADAEAALGA